MSPSGVMISPGTIALPPCGTQAGEKGESDLAVSPDRLVYRDQLGAVRESRLDLHVVDHLGDALHHLFAREDLCALLHQVSDGPAVARTLHDKIGNERDCLGMV